MSRMRSGSGRLSSVPPLPAQASPEVTIETKFHAPGVRKEWVERPDLLGYLASSGRLVLVTAPVGSGKTALVTQWRASTRADRRFAWVSLDEGDNDPGRLWWHIVRAVQRACPELKAEPFLQALAVQVPDITETVLPLLVNELAGVSAPVVVVLDDYDVIGNPACHAQIAFLLLHLPQLAQLVLITRTVPPLPLARLRASGELLEIGAGELRFAPAEAAQLVRATAGMELGETDLAVLVERTEGWAAGLYLAALTLRGHPSPRAFIRQFTGDIPFIADLLAEEVMARQPTEIREFLARTAILGRFCAQLCDAVTGSANSMELIDVLDRNNLFIVPLDDTRQWFRYQNLFAQVLRGQLAATEADLVPTLHERASAWHRHSGSVDEAIRHALAAGDPAVTVDLVGQHWYTYIDSGRMATVRGWLRSLGDDQIAANPVAAHCAAWVAALAGEPDVVRRWLPVVQAGQRDGPLPDGIQSLTSSAALLRATFGFGGIQDMRAAAATAVTLETDPASPWHGVAQAAFGAALYFSGELEDAAARARDALASTASLGHTRLLACTIISLAGVEQMTLDQADDLAQRAREIATDGDLGLVGSPQSSVAFLAAGAVYAARGRLQEARGELEQALRIRRRWPGLSPWYTLEILLRLAAVLVDLGDRHGAAQLMDDARSALGSLPEGSERYRARLERLEQRGQAAQPQATAGTGQLTERELAVLRMLSGTLSLREIGLELNLSQNTIKTHAQAIYRKLGVNTRSDAVQRARRIRGI
jgi:LuxR family transcriptional regulator, maltose regulon positive regulatory protein